MAHFKSLVLTHRPSTSNKATTHFSEYSQFATPTISLGGRFSVGVTHLFFFFFSLHPLLFSFVYFANSAGGHMIYESLVTKHETKSLGQDQLLAQLILAPTSCNNSLMATHYIIHLFIIFQRSGEMTIFPPLLGYYKLFNCRPSSKLLSFFIFICHL